MLYLLIMFIHYQPINIKVINYGNINKIQEIPYNFFVVFYAADHFLIRKFRINKFKYT